MTTTNDTFLLRLGEIVLGQTEHLGQPALKRQAPVWSFSRPPCHRSLSQLTRLPLTTALTHTGEWPGPQHVLELELPWYAFVHVLMEVGLARGAHGIFHAAISTRSFTRVTELQGCLAAECIQPPTAESAQQLSNDVAGLTGLRLRAPLVPFMDLDGQSDNWDSADGGAWRVCIAGSVTASRSD